MKVIFSEWEKENIVKKPFDDDFNQSMCKQSSLPSERISDKFLRNFPSNNGEVLKNCLCNVAPNLTK